MPAVREEGVGRSKEGIGEQEGKTTVGVYRKKEEKKKKKRKTAASKQACKRSTPQFQQQWA
jgi:hypothetical protein